MIKKNEEYIVDIIDNGFQGEGIAKIEGITVFIDQAIKGEKICRFFGETPQTRDRSVGRDLSPAGEPPRAALPRIAFAAAEKAFCLFLPPAATDRFPLGSNPEALECQTGFLACERATSGCNMPPACC